MPTRVEMYHLQCTNHGSGCGDSFALVDTQDGTLIERGRSLTPSRYPRRSNGNKVGDAHVDMFHKGQQGFSVAINQVSGSLEVGQIERFNNHQQSSLETGIGRMFPNRDIKLV